MTSNRFIIYGQARPASIHLFGREDEIRFLTTAVDQSARVIAITGAGGLGKSSLARAWADRQQEGFDAIVWCSFKDRPPLGETFYTIRQQLDPDEIISAADSVEIQLDALIDIMQHRRILLILDNLETLMLTGELSGRLHSDYNLLEALITRLCEVAGPGICMITSREDLELLHELQGGTRCIAICTLTGLKPNAVREFLQERGINGNLQDVEAFTTHHDGNPYAMRFAADYIRRNHARDGLHGYVTSGLPLPGHVTALLRHQFERLEELQKICVLRLAVERIPLAPLELIDSLKFRWMRSDITAAIEAIAAHSLFEPSADGKLSLQNLLVEFATEHVVHLLARDLQEAQNGDFSDALVALPAVRAQVAQHVRAAQLNAVVQPIIESYSVYVGTRQRRLEALWKILDAAKGKSTSQVGHGPGTVINLLVVLGVDFTGRDLSNLVLWDCCLEEVVMRDVSVRNSDLTGCMFSDVFGSVIQICFNKDGTKLFAVTSDGALRMWDLANWEHTVIRAHDGYARGIAFDSAHDRVLTVGEDGFVRRWRVNPLEHDRDLAHADLSLRCVATSPTGRLCAWGGSRGRLEVQAVDGLQQTVVLIGHHHDHVVRGAAFLDDSTLVSVDEAGAVYKWFPMQSQEPVASYSIDSPLWWVSYHHEKDILAVGGQRVGAVLLDPHLNRIGPPFQDVGPPSWGGAFIDDKIYVAVSSGAIVGYSLEDGKRVISRVLHLNWARTIAAHPLLPIVASGGEDQTICILNCETVLLLRTIRGSTRSFWSVAFSHSGDLLATAGNNKIVYIWKSDNPVPIQLSGYPGWIRALAFSPTNDLLAVAGDSGKIFLWDLSVSEYDVRILGSHSGPVWSLDFHPNGQFLASAGEDKVVRVWDLAHPGPSVGIRAHEHTSWVISTRYSLDGAYLASGDDDGAVIVSSTTGGNERTLRDQSAQQSWGLTWASNPTRALLSAGRDGVLRKWEITRGFPVAAVDCGRQLWACAWAPNAPTSVYVAGDGGIVTEHRLRDLTVTGTRKAGSARLHALAIDRRAGRLAAAGDDGAVTVWNYTSDRHDRLVPDRQYERLDVSGVQGVTDTQMLVLQSLGAITRPGVSDARNEDRLTDTGEDELTEKEIGDTQNSVRKRLNPGFLIVVVLIVVLLVLVALYFALA